MTAFTESVVEHAALAWLEGTSREVAHGPTSRRTYSRPTGVD
ncbi:MAG: hypothetical protein ACT4NU_07245 [Chromatiales bacterium]